MKKFLSLFFIIVIMFTITACNASTKKDGVVNSGDILNSGLSGGEDTDVEVYVKEDCLLDYGGDISKTEADCVRPKDGPTNKPEFSAGTLTAGEWKDADDLNFWTKLLNRNDWYELMKNRNLYTNKIVTVYVHDEEGNPCFNVETQLISTNEETIYTARTDINGKAYMLYNINNNDEKAASVLVNNKNFVLKDKSELDISIESIKMDVTELDLMLMIDTTGSMSDELIYLQKELEDVVKRIAVKDTALSINVSVNFYRDETDDYVVLDYDFNNDLTKSIKQLKSQDADGGGDYPEAVHEALNNAVNGHQWRKNAVKLCFLVLDAPPHSEEEISGINTQIQNHIQEAACEGIRIIPVASSGVDTETEFLMRSFALMTGGTYVFLTNHSGIGNSHLEPTIGQYSVEALNELMIRVISEYCGLN